MEWMAIAMFIAVCAALMAGYPVAFTLGGVSLLFAFIVAGLGVFNLAYLNFLPARLFEGVMWDNSLLAVLLFVLMGVMLDKSNVVEYLLGTVAHLVRLL